VGILDLFRGTYGQIRPTAFVSPYQSPTALQTLNPMVVADWLGPELAAQIPLDRAQAMSIPVVAKARHLLVSAISRLPMLELAGDATVGEPDWVHAPAEDNPTTPYDRMAWTVDDLIFYGQALWYVSREGVDGPILTAEFVAQSHWEMNAEGQIVLVGGGADIVLRPEEYLLFNPPHEGLLGLATRTLRGAIDTENAWVSRMRNPIPMIDLHRTDDDEVTDDELRAYVNAWSEARRSLDGAVGSTPAHIDLRVLGASEGKSDLFVEGRNALRTDIASFLNLRASMLDGTSGTDSLTYTTREGERNLFYELDLPYWTDPIEARLSMNDVVPAGSRIRFDRGQIINAPTPTGPATED
jgi:hypothetical protein